jgi:hypothetical protein
VGAYDEDNNRYRVIVLLNVSKRLAGMATGKGM